MSLHVPAGACIPVASVSPIHVPPVQRVLKHCDAHKHIYIIYIYIYIYTHVIQNNLRTPQLAGFARQLECKNVYNNTIQMCILNCEQCVTLCTKILCSYKLFHALKFI